MASPYAIAVHWYDVYTNRRRIKLCLFLRRELTHVDVHNHFTDLIHNRECIMRIINRRPSSELRQLVTCFFSDQERHYWAMRNLNYGLALGSATFDAEHFINIGRLLAIKQAQHPELLVSKPTRARMAQAWEEFKRQNNPARCGTITAFNRYWRSIQDKTHAQTSPESTIIADVVVGATAPGGPVGLMHRKKTHGTKKTKCTRVHYTSSRSPFAAGIAGRGAEERTKAPCRARGQTCGTVRPAGPPRAVGCVAHCGGPLVQRCVVHRSEYPL